MSANTSACTNTDRLTEEAAFNADWTEKHFWKLTAMKQGHDDSRAIGDNS